jgi:hypothetical protein
MSLGATSRGSVSFVARSTEKHQILLRWRRRRPQQQQHMHEEIGAIAAANLQLGLIFYGAFR